jgi:hypothetical protein
MLQVGCKAVSLAYPIQTKEKKKRKKEFFFLRWDLSRHGSSKVINNNTLTAKLNKY